MTFELLWQVTGLLVGLFLFGSIACLPLFKWNLRTFFHSRLWMKIYWWWPIYIVLLLVLYGGWPVAGLVVILLIVQAVLEWRQRRAYRSILATTYVFLFVATISQLVSISFLFPTPSTGLISICLASVLSDVCAFFAGSYIGRHTLPDWINPGKSWEGVIGQLVGAFLGMSLAAVASAINFSWSLALVVGIASALGDIMNSVAKRQLSIKDWSQFIPGHGGVLDRFSSLSFAIAAGYITLLAQ